MAAILKHWREAATLILVARAKEKLPRVIQVQSTKNSEPFFNYSILMLKRSRKSKFMPSYSVFPGGVAHDADFSGNWLDIFNLREKEQFIRSSLGHITNHEGAVIPMLSRKRDEKFSVIPAELAFRICAIRETFEESGILLARKIEITETVDTNHSLGSVVSISEAMLAQWRQRVDNDANEFLNMCRELSIVPDVWSLYEWSNWLTPVHSGDVSTHSQRRYDTAFFISVLDDVPPTMHDEKETVASQWATPSEIIQAYCQSKQGLAPPQLFELSRLLNFQDVRKLENYMFERSGEGITRIFPVTIFCNDGLIVAYPGDELYPENLDQFGEKESISMKGTVESLGKKCLRKCRLEIGSQTGDMIFVCNLEFNGHIMPVTDWSYLKMGPKANL